MLNLSANSVEEFYESDRPERIKIVGNEIWLDGVRVAVYATPPTSRQIESLMRVIEAKRK